MPVVGPAFWATGCLTLANLARFASAPPVSVGPLILMGLLPLAALAGAAGWRRWRKPSARAGAPTDTEALAEMDDISGS